MAKDTIQNEIIIKIYTCIINIMMKGHFRISMAKVDYLLNANWIERRSRKAGNRSNNR